MPENYIENKDGSITYIRESSEDTILLIQPRVKHLDLIAQYFEDLEGADIAKSMQAIQHVLTILCMVNSVGASGKETVSPMSLEYLAEIPLNEFGEIVKVLRKKLAFFRSEEEE